MSARARLLGLRVQGFKSFAERTRVEFGAGINAIVGPNGSGKSNLADALRWALGEQGRSLRIRRSEDVIWAGSERRTALGMADVTLMLDNGDALLPVEYSVVELGRRLYRSGENDYLLNRQRVRLRDLVDLLDGANLAENAFLFIGQGMVDQALALRPEERRPLFEEVAGVRRHERRRRKAEEQLAEAEANLARVEDVLAELRPQARRLGQLAEQQASRVTAGEELAAALVTAAHARWHAAAARATVAAGRHDALRAEVEQSLGALETAESSVARIAASMAARADAERERRAAHEAARSAASALALREARATGEVEATDRDRARIGDERAAAEADLAAQRRILAEPVPERDLELDTALGEAERALTEALSELGALRSATRERGEEAAAVRRAAAARATEVETARRRLVDARRRAAEERAGAVQAEARRRELEAQAAEARTTLVTASEAEAAARTERERARTSVDALEGASRAAVERASGLGSTLAAARGRHEQLRRRLAEEEQRGIARAARRMGGRRVDQDLGVDPAFREAVEAALGDLARAYVVDRAATAALAGERGRIVVNERLGPPPGSGAGGAAGQSDVADAVGRGVAAERSLDDRLATLGGGRLGGAVRRDPTGAVRALLARVAWVPDVHAALDVQDALPAGWLAVTRDGVVVADALSVRLGRGDTPLERRAQEEQLAREVEALAAEADAAERDAGAAVAALSRAREALEAARLAESSAFSDRRRAEERERSAGRDLEAATREGGWRAAQATRLEAEAERARVALSGMEAGGEVGVARGGAAVDGSGESSGAEATAAWEARVADLRARRDRLAADTLVAERARRDGDARRARAEAAATLAEERIAAAERQLAQLADRERKARDEHGAVVTDLAVATAAEVAARDALEALLAADRMERSSLAEAERAATAARERLRTADDRARDADVAALEARLALDALREQLLVELAGLGEVGVRHLEMAGGFAGTGTRVEEDGAPADGLEPGAEGAALEAALDEVAPRWAAEPATAEAPSPARLAVLRRRFHELGAANPFAVDEYRAVRDRLESLEAQDRDLRAAIARTRTLIGDLDTLIATQFRATFAALEVAFDARFRQLFDGGFARLSLTEPADLAATGVEITARPPGKKPQTLSMLSGGERALTAVALLFAMLEVRPTPFCVLDEVDAALDEANVGRFTEALRELAERTQFIVITHNRGTIEVADALYGVTVGEDSVSRVISLRLDEAQAIAEPGRPAAQAVTAGERPG